MVDRAMSAPRNPARPATGLAILSLIMVGMFATTAIAEERHDERRPPEHRQERQGGWGGGGYRAPPIIYGDPGYYSPYYAPPVVYGPSVGIVLPGIGINIR